MQIIINALIVIIGLIVAFVILDFVQGRKTSKELKARSLTELEDLVYRYETEYFKLIGENNESVVEFRQAIENKDISALNKNWLTLRSSFRALERTAGHSDRPLIMDFYNDYEIQIKELYLRKRKDNK